MMLSEHQHYDTIEQFFKESISKGSDFLFDTRFFNVYIIKYINVFDIGYINIRSKVNKDLLS